MASRIGGALDAGVIESARSALGDASVMPLFDEDTRGVFVFEGLNDVSRAAFRVCQAWLQNTDNIRRVYQYFGKPIPAFPDLLRRFGTMRVRQLARPIRLKDGIRGEHGIWVLIPLYKWSRENGFWLDEEVMPGQDVCIDGREPIDLPGTGGCVVIMMCLKD